MSTISLVNSNTSPKYCFFRSECADSLRATSRTRFSNLGIQPLFSLCKPLGPSLGLHFRIQSMMYTGQTMRFPTYPMPRSLSNVVLQMLALLIKLPCLIISECFCQICRCYKTVWSVSWLTFQLSCLTIRLFHLKFGS